MCWFDLIIYCYDEKMYIVYPDELCEAFISIIENKNFKNDLNQDFGVIRNKLMDICNVATSNA